nr:uncharacterized protein LOC107278065 [Oryza sativa Japonica Group]
MTTAASEQESRCGGGAIPLGDVSNSPSPCANPGHYIALVTLRVAEEMRPPPPPPARAERHSTGTVQVTRVKLLKPRDTLLLGQPYRLITVDEVTRVLQAKKEEKSRRAAAQHHLESKPAGAAGVGINSSGDDHTQLDDEVEERS